MANIPNTRQGNTVAAHTKLKDGEMLVQWSGFSNIRVDAYSVEQRMLAAQCEAVVNEGDPTILDVTYSGDSPQYLGLCKIIVRGIYDGRKKTYDAPLVNFVPDTAQATGVIVVTDPEVNVLIDVEEVSTSVLDEAIAAALTAADIAAHAVGPQGPEGPQGATGPQGPAGPQGPKGDTGDYLFPVFSVTSDMHLVSEEGIDRMNIDERGHLTVTY